MIKRKNNNEKEKEQTRIGNKNMCVPVSHGREELSRKKTQSGNDTWYPGYNQRMRGCGRK